MMHLKTKIIIDVLMIFALFLSMSLQLFGGGVHKMIGLVTFLLFLIHNMLNLRWYKNIFSGTYKPVRIAHLIINMVVILAMFGIIVSGVMLAKEMAQGITGPMTEGRFLHLVSSYVECGGIALHIGFHLKRRKENV